jgi:ADP-ribose pyrophosphatase YjhB (NUDIX family)
MEPNCLKWARQLAALSQDGLTYSQNPYEIERYQHIREIAAEMMVAGPRCGGAESGIEKKTVLELLSREEGYATPKVDVRAAAFRDDKLLMVREKLDDGWTLPGGWADPWQSPSEAAVREAVEESGFHVRVTKLAAVYDRSKHPHLPYMPFHIYKHFFICEITGGSATPSYETTGVDFFARDALPEKLSISRTLPEQLARMFDHYHNPALPTDFD